jgi:hypothetical protein
LKLSTGKYIEINANIVPVISGNVQKKSAKLFSDEHMKHLFTNLNMAEDLSSNKESSKVDLLLGNDYYLDIVMCQRMEVKPGLYLLASKLGWILTGRIQETSVYENETNMLILTHGSNVCVSTTNVFASVDSVVQTKPELEDFWKIESLGITDSQDNTNDEIALMKFKDTLIYDNGMYQVTWPWKEETPELPENREQALARLKSNIARMKNKPEVLKKYNEVIQDQLSKKFWKQRCNRENI